ncbi:MAG: hypothetical protein KIT63_05385 [Rhodoferax sp.]|nr:hypothetical protein [Rhodoferax sp.]
MIEQLPAYSKAIATASGSSDEAPTPAFRIQADGDCSRHCEDQHLRELLSPDSSFQLLDYRQGRTYRTGFKEPDQVNINWQSDRIRRGNPIHCVAVLTGEHGRLAGSRLIDACGTRRNLGVDA